jgi:hypothetical protein
VQRNYTSEVVKAAKTNASYSIYALGMVEQNDAASGARVVLVVSKSQDPMNVTLDGAASAPIHVLEASGAEPGFQPPTLRRADTNGRFPLGPFAVALVTIPKGNHALHLARDRAARGASASAR